MARRRRTKTGPWHRKRRTTETVRRPYFGAMLMSKKIAAGNVRLKRAYDRPAAGDGIRILIDRLWRAVSRRRTQPSINGPRTSRPAPRYGNGSGTILRAGKNFATATRGKCTSILTSLTNYGLWHGKVRLHWYSLRMTKFTTTLSR